MTEALNTAPVWFLPVAPPHRIAWRLNCPFPCQNTILIIRGVVGGIACGNTVCERGHTTSVQLAGRTERNNDVLRRSIWIMPRSTNDAYKINS